MTYIINTDEHARNRLSLQHSLYVDSSLSLLSHAGIRNSSAVLEVGCGNGDMTVNICALLPESAFLTCIDSSEQQLQATQTKIQDSNVEFVLMDVSDILTLGKCFDLIYVRMVLHHLRDANCVLESLVDCLHPGGRIIVQEPDIHDATFCYPLNQHVNTFRQWVSECFQRTECDYEVCYRAAFKLSQLGLTILHHDLHHPLLTTSEQRQLYALSLKDLAEPLQQHNIAKKHEIDTLYQQLMLYSSEPGYVTWIRMHNILAQKL